MHPLGHSFLIAFINRLSLSFSPLPLSPLSPPAVFVWNLQYAIGSPDIKLYAVIADKNCTLIENCQDVRLQSLKNISEAEFRCVEVYMLAHYHLVLLYLLSKMHPLLSFPQFFPFLLSFFTSFSSLSCRFFLMRLIVVHTRK